MADLNAREAGRKAANGPLGQLGWSGNARTSRRLAAPSGPSRSRLVAGCLPAEVGAYVRLVLVRARHPIVALGVLLDGDLKYPHQSCSNVLHGRRLVSPGEWDRIRKLVGKLAAELEPLPEPECAPKSVPARNASARVNLAAVPADRPRALKKRSGEEHFLPAKPSRHRDRINPEIIGLAMTGHLREGAPRPVGPHHQRLAA